MFYRIFKSWLGKLATVNPIVANGYWRALRANRSIIWAEVKADYDDQMTDASPKQKRRVRSEMKREFRKRLRERVPANALY